MAKDLLIISEAIEKFLDERKYTTLRDVLKTMQAADIAALFEILPRRKLSLLFRLLPKEQAAEAFVEMDLDLQEHLIHGFSDNELKEIVDELYLDDTVDMVEELPANVVKRILAQANPETRQLINEMLQYPEDSAGSVMTTEYVDLSADMTVPDAIKHIKRTGVDKETINVCYVTSSDRKLIGEVPIRSLILAEDKETVGEIMQKNVISVTTQEDQEEVAQTFAKYDCIALPVVDSEGRLVGIVTVDDAIDILQSEATEDIDKMAAVTPSDRPYLKLSTFAIYKSRIPWLLILMISATFTGSIITHYESALSSYLVLDGVHPHADGYRRQLRQPGFGDDHPRHQPAADQILRYLPRGVEGDSGGAAVRSDLGGGEFRQADLAEQGDGHRGGGHLPDAGLYRVCCEDRRLYAADSGKACRRRPGGYGKPVFDDDRRRTVADHLF